MRRLTLRAAGLVAIALSAITCTDATTAPGTRAPAPARLGLAPSFSPAAARANTVLAEAGVVVTQVHIVLRTVDGAVAKDTTIAFPATQDTLNVELALQIQGTEQSFTARLDLQDANGVVLFSQTQLVTARASTLPAAPPPVIVLEYVGPGATARAVTVSPTDLTLSPNTPLALAATATDSAGRPLPDLIVGWTSSDTSIATVVATGRAAATVTGTGRRGSVTISATTPNGIAGTAHFSLLPLAARLVVVSGDAQSGVAGHALAQPLVLELQGLDGGPIPNAAVVLKAVTPGASVGTAAGDTLLTTDAAGRASATLTLGRVAGSYAFQARAGTLLAPAISETATAAPAVALALLSGNGQSGAAGSALAQPFAVSVTNEFGDRVAGATVAWTRSGGSGTLAAATSVTDTAGVARMTYTLGTSVGTDSIRASLPGLTTPASTTQFTTTATAGAAAKLLFVQAPQDTIVVGGTFAPLSARLADGFGNPVRRAGVMVLIRGRAPDSSGYADSTLTDTAGVAHVVLGDYKGVAGRLVLTLASAGLDSLVRQIIAVSGPAAQLHVVSGVPTTAASGVAFPQPVVLQVTDVGGNAVAAAVTVTATVSGGATLSGTTTVTSAADGRATFGALTMNGVAGSYQLHFDAAGLTGVITPPVTLTGGIASALAIAAGDGQTGAVGSSLPVQPTVRVTDANGNPVRGGHVIFSARHGGRATPDTVLVDANGAAATQWTLGTVVGADTLVARLDSSTVAPVTFVATATAGAPARFTVAVSSTTPVAGQPVSVQAQLEDAAGNPVRASGHVVTWSASATGGSFSPATSTTDANGLAQATYTTPTTAGVSVVLTATEGSAAGSSAAVVTQVGTGSMLGFSGGWLVSGTTASGSAFVPQPVVQLLDANGNAVRTAGVVVTATVASGPSRPIPAGASATTDANGQATFSGLAITGLAGDYTLAFGATGYSALASAALHVGAGAVSGLAFSTQPPATTTAGAAFAFAVSALDASGNVVTGFTGPVSVAITGGTGHPGAALHDSTGASAVPMTRTAVNGVATFDRVTVDSAGTAYTLAATATGAAGATSSALDVAAGAPTQLAIAGASPTSASSGAPLSPQPAIQLRDAVGNNAALAGVTVTATIASGSATLTNATATTNAAGTATFSGLTISGTAGTVTLAYSATGYTGATSAPITLGAGAPGQLTLRTAPSATAASGAAFAQAAVVQLEDASGNAVSAPGVAIAATVSSGGTLLGTTTVNTSALGQASFDGLGISGAAGAYTLTFSSSGLTPATASVTLTAGAPASLTALEGDGQAGGLGGLASIPPKVAVKDASNNPVSGASVLFTAVSAGDSVSNGTMGRTATVVTDANGEATLAAWKFGTTGFDTVTATVGALSARFTATTTVGAATHFVVISGGGQSGPVTTMLAQPVVVEARDANEQPVPNVPMVVNYSFDTDNGFVRVAGVNYDCGDCITRDSTNTDAQGRASFTWQLSYHAKVDSVYVENEQVGATLVTATAVPGPAALLVFDTPGGLDDDAGNTLNPFRVIVSDAGGYDTLKVSGNITLELRQYRLYSCDGTCPPPPTPNGTLTAAVVDGVATFSNISIPSAASNLFFVASYDQAAEVSGSSDLFDIAPAGPHFVVVGSYPSDVVAGTAVQIQLRSQDAHGNALPFTTVMAFRGDFNGSVDLTGGGAPSYRDSSTTDANGLTMLTWVMPPNPQSDLSISVSNYQTAQPLYLYANAVLGPPARLMPTPELALDDDVGNTLNPFQLYITDVGGNHLSGIDTSLTIALTGGDPTAKLSQEAAVRFVDGVAYVTGLSIDKVGASYKLQFSVPGASWTGETDIFDISPTGVPPMASLQVQGRPQFVMVPSGASTLRLVATDGSQAPVANQHVVVFSYNPAVCWFSAPGGDHEGAFTDASGVATLTVHGSTVQGGCSLQAQADNNGTSYLAQLQGAVYGGSATHVWVPTAGSRFEEDSSWVRVSDAAPGVPAASDRVYIAQSNWGYYPQLTGGGRDLAGVEMEQGTQLELNGYALTISGDVNAANALIENGPVIVRGRSAVSGTIQDLQLGGSGDCTGDDLTVQNLSTYTSMKVRCRTTVGVNVTNDSLVVVPGAALLMAGPGSTLTANHADVRGDSLAIDGHFSIGSTATLAPAALTMASTSFLTVGGDAVLGTNGTSRLSLAGKLYFGGTLTEQGTGTSMADTIVISGDALFDGSSFVLTRGVLDLAGNFNTGSSHASSAFQASGDHLTRFVGYAAQAARFTYGGTAANQSHFARVQVANGYAPVTFPYGWALVAGPDSLRLELLYGSQLSLDAGGEIQGNAHVGTNATLTINGLVAVTTPAWLRLFDGSSFIVNNAFSGNCTDIVNGTTSSNVTIGGTGTINGGQARPGACSAQ